MKSPSCSASSVTRLLGQAILPQKQPLDKIVQRFRQTVRLIEGSGWKQVIATCNRIYNLKPYNIDKLTPRKVLSLYDEISDKYEFAITGRYYTTDRSKPSWHENELRVYMWLLLTYSGLVGRQPSQFTEQNWQFLVDFFVGKTTFLCEFQYRNLHRLSEKIPPWSKEEDELLRDCMKDSKREGKWNDLAKELFHRSDKKFFRSAKQCRERWNNYLDPTKKRESWTAEEDLALVRCVMERGKKWSAIARLLQQQRTEHTVKNRYKSLFAKYHRTIPKSRQRYLSEKDVLRILEEQLVGTLTKKPEQQQKSSDPLTAVEPTTEVIEQTKKEKKNESPIAARSLSAFSKTRTESFSKPLELQTPAISNGHEPSSSSMHLFGIENYTPAMGFNSPLPPVALTPYEMQGPFYSFANQFSFDQLRR